MQWFIVDQPGEQSLELERRLPVPNREDIAFLQYTSGSTSDPKGVMVTHGNLIEIIATAGNVSDYTAAPLLIKNCSAEYLIADKGYDSNTIREAANERGISDQIPTRKTNSRPNEHFDVDLYRLRHLVENFFCRIKRYRAIATRYDKLVRNFLSFVYFAATLEALK